MSTFLSLAYIAALVFIGEAALFVWSLFGIARDSHSFHSSANPKPQTSNQQKEDHSMKKSRLALVGVIAALLALCALLPGCALFPTLGNGKLDMPVEIEVVYVDSMGVEYHAEAGPNGAAFYITVDGAVFTPVEYGDDGLIITGPDGSRIRVKKIAEVPAPDPPPAADASGEAMEILNHMESLP